MDIYAAVTELTVPNLDDLRGALGADWRRSWFAAVPGDMARAIWDYARLFRRVWSAAEIAAAAAAPAILQKYIVEPAELHFNPKYMSTVHIADGCLHLNTCEFVADFPQAADLPSNVLQIKIVDGVLHIGCSYNNGDVAPERNYSPGHTLVDVMGPEINGEPCTLTIFQYRLPCGLLYAELDNLSVRGYVQALYNPATGKFAILDDRYVDLIEGGNIINDYGVQSTDLELDASQLSKFTCNYLTVQLV